MDAFHAVVHQGHEGRVAVQQGQELEGFFRMLGSGVDSHHSALGSGGVNISVGAGHELDFSAASQHVSGVLITESVGLGADQVGSVLLVVGAAVIGGFTHGQGGINVAGFVILVHLFCKGLVFGSAELVDQLVAVDAVSRHIFRIQVQGQQVGGTGVTGHDDGVGDHTLGNHGLHEEGIEAVALDFLSLGEDFVPAEESLGLEIVHGVAQLVQQGDVHVPGVLGGGVFEAVDGVDALAFSAFDGGGLHQAFRDGGLQVGTVLLDQVIQLQEVALLGVAVVFVRAPGAGEDDVNILVAGGQGIDGLLVEVAPGAPDDFQFRADFVSDVLVDFFEHGGVVGNVAAMEHDGDGGQIVSGGKAAHGQDQRQGQNERQELFHGHPPYFQHLPGC